MKEGRCGQKHSGGQIPVRVAGRCEISGVVHNDVPATPNPSVSMSKALVNQPSESRSPTAERLRQDVLVLDRQQTLFVWAPKDFYCWMARANTRDQLNEFCLLEVYVS